MLRGYYTAASGIVTQEKRLNAYANNITNASTVGYKKDNLVSGVFGEQLSVRMNAYQSAAHNPVGQAVYMQVIDEKYTDYEQGGFEFTQRPMDLAVQGEGFFVVSNENGEYLTRDGQFSLDEEGYLILPGFGRVQGENGPIQIGTSFMSVDRMGNVYTFPPDAEEEAEATLVDTLRIAVPADITTLDKADNGLYTADGYTAVSGADTAVLSGALERSNVNMAEEMTRVIASQRSLQTCSQIVKMYDEMADKITSQVSRV